MITRSTRPLTNSEREILSKTPRHPLIDAFFASAFTIMGILLVYAVLCRIHHSFKRIDSFPLAPFIVLVPAVLVGIWVYRKTEKLFGKNLDLEQGIMEILTVEAYKAIKVKEFEDEGIGFYLDIGDGKVLFLQGQYLYEYEDEHRFPCTRFILTRTPHGGLVFDLKCEGGYLPPIHTNPPFTVEDYKNNIAPYDGQVLQSDFELLRK